MNLRKISTLAFIMVFTLTSFAFANPASFKQNVSPVSTEKTTSIHKIQGSKLLSTLHNRLESGKENQKYPVIVSYKTLNRMRSMKPSQSRFSPTKVYKNVPAMAATLTKSQIERLSKSPDVSQIEYDEQVKTTAHTANYWYGTEAARTDFGVSGDGDEDPNSYSKEDTVIAIIDTGIDASHVDLNNGKVIGWSDLVNNKTTPYDDQGHGTHVASIAAGSGAGNKDYQGVAPGAALVGIKVLDKNGSGQMSNVIDGIDWAISNKDKYNIKVINMSLGTPFSSDGTDATSQAVNRAVEAGIVTCVAAGNSGPAKKTVGAPGAATKALTVGATADPSQGGFHLAYFSSRGETADGRIKPDIAAPGFNITAADANTGNGYVAHSGTSMATPFMAGTVGLILSANPSLSPEEVQSLVTSTANDFGPKGADVDYGFGNLNGYKAIKQAGNFSGNGAPTLPNHLFGKGNIKSIGKKDEWTFSVTSAEAPISISLIMPNWTGFWFFTNMDFDVYLYDSNGKEIAKSEEIKRQETISFKPTTTGKYTLKVRSYHGTGDYFFDISTFGSSLKQTVNNN